MQWEELSSALACRYTESETGRYFFFLRIYAVWCLFDAEREDIEGLHFYWLPWDYCLQRLEPEGGISGTGDVGSTIPEEA